MPLSDIRQKAREFFAMTYGRDPDYLAVAPGRVNLIGEHTDYHEGFVFPAAIDRHIVIAASRAKGKTAYVSEGRGRPVRFNLGWRDSLPEVKWVRYAAGVGSLLVEAGAEPVEVEAAVVTDLPTGAGLSSSAAMEMAAGVLYRDLMGLDLDPVALARIGQKCENEILNVPCGLMDQLASACGVQDRALLIDIRNPEALQPIGLPPGVGIVVCDTGEKHRIGESGYPTRRRESFEAAAALGVKMLRDANLTMLDAKRGTMSDVVFRRGRHIITENARCLAFAEALIAGDRPQLRALMDESHESMRADYEISTQKLDDMQRVCLDAPGCIGARMTGGGFGGACVAVVDTLDAEAFATTVTAGFERLYPGCGRLISARASEGAKLERNL